MRIRNPQFLKRPWLFTIYTFLGAALPLYFGGPSTLHPEVIAVAAGVVAVVNVWFFVSLKRTRHDQKSAQNFGMNSN